MLVARAVLKFPRHIELITATELAGKILLSLPSHGTYQVNIKIKNAIHL